MVLQTVQGHRRGEDVDDLKAWLSELHGCPTVSHTLAAACTNEVHGADPATWFYVEGDPTSAVARRRCLACSTVVPLLDSEEHWSYPPMWACLSCQQSIAEVAFGVHTEPASGAGLRVTWLAMGVRCVGCGRFDGITDLHVPHLSLAEVAAQV